MAATIVLQFCARHKVVNIYLNILMELFYLLRASTVKNMLETNDSNLLKYSSINTNSIFYAPIKFGVADTTNCTTIR